MKVTPPKVQDLSNRAIFQVTGEDAVRYINGQVSQDVHRASSELAVYSIVATFKGKIQGDLFLRIHDGVLLIDTSESQRESLLMRLDKYLIADDAEIIDVTEKYQLYHTLGEVDSDLTRDALAVWECDRYGVAGKDYLYKKPYVHSDTDSVDAWEKFRISQGIPDWVHELDNDILPPEAGLEDRAISYTKGCYTGQEVISRMKSAGKTNRHLVGFTLAKEVKCPLDLYTAADAEGKAQATLTSVCKDGADSYLGLGYRMRKSEAVTEFYDREGNVYHIR